MLLRTGHFRQNYSLERDGSPSHWKREFDRGYFSPDDALAVWRNLLKVGCIPSRGKMSALFTGTNFPSHEIAIFNYEAERNPRREFSFLACDLIDIDEERLIQPQIKKRNDKQVFHYRQADVADLRYPGSFDIISDRLGFIWHQIQESDLLDDVFSAFLHLYAMLKDRGKLVIDARKDSLSTTFWIEQKVPELFYRLNEIFQKMEYVGENEQRVLVLTK